MQIFAKTDKGMVRNVNQDAYAANILSDGSAFAVVCDGMGGANAGDVASKTAVEVISRYVTNSYAPSMTLDDIARLLNNAVVSANIEIFDMSQTNADLNGMGTTAVITVVRGEKAVIVNVGDSRAYLINGKLTQITRDHSVVQSLVESGKLSMSEARVHPEKNVITRALGVENDILCDAYCVDFSSDDKLLLCTDGLSNFVDGTDILYIVNNTPCDKISDLLIQKANKNGGRDNITAVVISH